MADALKAIFEADPNHMGGYMAAMKQGRAAIASYEAAGSAK